MLAEIALIAGAYLLGSLPHLPLLARLRHVNLNGDFHQTLWNKGGKWLAIIGVLGEFCKGILPVLVGKALDFEPIFVALAGLAAVVGQMWPVFHKFDGEKGNSIALAMVFALSYQPALVGIIPVLISLLVRTAPRLPAKSRGNQPVVGGHYSRSLPVGMFLCFLLLPLAAWYFDEPPAVVWTLAALFVLMIIIRRLTAGLSADLKSSRDIKTILFNRLLYDRSTVGWRQPQT
jgi:glycerol-3-phosphate acyltransferase PlsY